ncbi:MAG: aminopeptidase [Candidatus Helarchaeota archaeon]
MISDHKLRSLAKLIINHSCSLKKNENVLIEAVDVPYFFIEILIEEILKKNAWPFMSLKSDKFIRKIGLFATKKYYEIQSNIEIATLQKVNAYIGIKNVLNAFGLSDLPYKKHEIIYKNYLKPVHLHYRNNFIKWVYLRWPSESMAQRAEISLKNFQDYYFNACNID